MTDVLPGAEPLSFSGDSTGVLAIHGFTGSPNSMRPIAQAMVADGHTVEMPRLPGHGTRVDDMVSTTWADWTKAVEDVYTDLASRVERVVVTGLSMGGSLTIWLATQHADIVGIVPINPLAGTTPAGMAEVQAGLDSGAVTVEAIGNDIAKQGVDEVSYDATPLAALMSLFEGVNAFQEDLGSIKMPCLIITSRQDHTVPPASSDHLAQSVGGPVERLWLDDSYHVATLDHDEARIVAALRSFIAGL